MKNRSTFRLIGLAGIGTLMAVPAFAQLSNNFYGGVSVGESRTKADTPRTTGLVLPGVDTIGSSIDRSDAAFKIFGGYQMTPYLAIESGYFDLGRSRFTSQTMPAGTLKGETRVQGMNIDLVGKVPFTDKFSALARAGFQQAWSKERYSGTGAGAGVAYTTKHDDPSFKVGVGMQYQLTPAVWIRGELERYRIKDITGRRQNIDVASASLVFPFGRAAEPRVAAAAPVYVAPAPVPAPMPAPVVVVVPAPAPVAKAPVPQRVSFEADALFGSDASAVRPEGKTALDAFSTRLDGASYQTITVEGHTDRMGTDAYNQTLSDERAASVKNYLVTSGRLDPAKINAVGKGESTPVTQAADCSDKLGRAQLITCLQPDRRVEVEVTGTR
jgi:OOP family OmpA-OmpF porin